MQEYTSRGRVKEERPVHYRSTGFRSRIGGPYGHKGERRKADSNCQHRLRTHARSQFSNGYIHGTEALPHNKQFRSD